MREICICKSVSKACIKLIRHRQYLFCAFLDQLVQLFINHFRTIERKNRNIGQIFSVVTDKILSINQQFDFVLKVRKCNPELYTDFLDRYRTVICRKQNIPFDLSALKITVFPIIACFCSPKIDLKNIGTIIFPYSYPL